MYVLFQYTAFEGNLNSNGDGAFFLNPNNAGGIGVGNGNIERFEAIEITTPGPGSVSGFTLDVTGVGGNVKNTASVIFRWEAREGGVLVDSGFVDITGIDGVETLSVTPLFDFDTVYVSFEGLDHNDKLRINNISVQQAVEIDDFALSSTLGAEENDSPFGTGDGDVATDPDNNLPVDEYVVTVQVDGTDDDMVFG